MNIFITDSDPVKCAHALDDKRVGKLLMEQNHMLSLAIKEHYWIDDWYDFQGPGMLVKGEAYKNHPCSIWVRANQANFNWTMCHAFALGEEWTHRFGTIHGSFERTKFMNKWINTQRDCLPAGEMLPFQNSAKNQGLGIDFTHLPVPISYREYLKKRWLTDTKPVIFTNREMPRWRWSTQ